MDTLRNTLAILFRKAEIEPLLKNTVPKSVFDTERFVRCFQHRSPDLTFAQCRLTAGMMERSYMQMPEGMPKMQHKNVFNTLLHFNRVVLREYGGRPVCKFEHLLRWNELTLLIGEDLLTTSFLAGEDIQRGTHRRSAFDWDLVIDQDDPDLRALLRRKIADVHMHLKGSSSNFDLNWLCLMNYPQGREKAFKRLSVERYPFSLHALVIKACAIRYRLYLRYVCGYAPETLPSYLMQIIGADTDIAAKMQAHGLEVMLAAERLASNGYGTLLNHDYIWQVDDAMVKSNPNCILSGERQFLYECFRALYSGGMPECDSNQLYAYILIKNKIRNELIQANDVVGFDNFNAYENRKTLFIDGRSVYSRLLEPVAIGQYFYRGKDRYVEPRIAPKDTATTLAESIDELDRDIESLTTARKDSDYRYVLHFIKQQDKTPLKSEPLHPRHHQLRNTVHKQAMAIDNLCKRPRFGERIAGIDAANSEIYARPEVFAQAFRFLRRTAVSHGGGRTADLGMTYHVGEDFLSLIDGLRAIDEVLHFLNFRRGDRLGHALVLGVDPVKYIQSRHNRLLLPKMLVLDDIAWVLATAEAGGCLANFRGVLENQFYRIFRQVYGAWESAVTPRDYYDAWLLRGDNPDRYTYLYTAGLDKSVKVSPWSRCDLNQDPDAVAARKNPVACRLYYAYHYNQKVRRRGEDIMEWDCPDDIAKLIAALQKQLIRQLQKMNIGVETNPTSNFRIGGFGRYRDLPIAKFVPLDSAEASLSASVNTDDCGVFANSIEREYALLACAMTKSNADVKPGSMFDICDWLDRIRQKGLAQRFIPENEI